MKGSTSDLVLGAELLPFAASNGGRSGHRRPRARSHFHVSHISETTGARAILLRCNAKKGVLGWAGLTSLLCRLLVAGLPPFTADGDLAAQAIALCIADDERGGRGMTTLFRLVPTRRGPEGDWLRSWELVDSQERAVRSACDYYARSGIPVLVRRLDEARMAVETVGVFGDGERPSKGRRRR